MRSDWVAGDFASRSTAKAKPQKRDSASSSTRTLPINQKTWTDVEPREYLISDYVWSVKKLTRLWSDWILENKRFSSETFLVLSSLVWWQVEEQDGKEEQTRTYFSIVLARQEQSWTSDSSRSFRTQSHWSFTAGQFVNAEQFLQIHFSRIMCDQCTFHYQFGIDIGRSKF